MLSNPNIDLVSRFLRLPLEQRQQFYQRLQTRGMSFGQLPIAPAREAGQPLPLSYAQERQWFLWQLDPDSAAYHIPGVLRLSGRLDKSALQRSFDRLLERHESLRTRLHLEGDNRSQVVLAHAVVDIIESTVTEDGLQARVQALIAEPFDLQHGALLRVNLLNLGEDEHVLVLVQHHIVSDGWSMGVMVQELMQLYAAYSNGQDCQLAALPIQYADYALWQRRWMEAGEKERQLSYWREQLGGSQPVLELPFDHPRPARQSYRGARQDVALEPALVAGLKALAQREGVTLFMLLLASFQTLLYRYSGQSDIRIGVPTANRNRAETERLIGFFVNTQVLKADLDGQMTFRQLLAQVKERTLQAQSHQDLPFEQLVEALQPERSLSHNPLFQVMFNHQAQTRTAVGEQQLSGLGVTSLEWASESAQFDLSLDTEETDQGLWASWTFATDLFAAATVARMAQHWQTVLHAMVASAGSRLAQLTLLADGEQRDLLNDWNNGGAAFESPLGVHGLFEVQAQRRPDAIALCLDEQTLTYAELNREANRLAHYLIGQGVGPEVMVGVAVERSFAMVVSLLAILKAGGAYVPLDPQYPRDRLLHMLEDSHVRLVVCQSAQPLPLPAEVARLDIDSAKDALQRCAESNPRVPVDPQNLAYVIYTSGSTGKPKGVAINHAALTEFSGIAAGYSRLSEDDRVLQFATLNFDGFVEQLYPALTHGATVVLRGAELWDSGRLYAEIIRQGITLADLPTAYWNLFLLDCLAAGPRSYGALRQIHIGGEAMPLDGPAQWLKAGLGHVRLLNTYGPTEATVVSSVLDCSRGEETIGATASPIGRSLPGRALYVLDRDLNLAPLGAVGELYIGSQCGLARAYLNRPLLTAERFVPDPFGGDRLYRTGDLARYRADGVIEYVGRVDHQVKIRGFRIELGEIEALLLAQDGVRETLVLAADNQLVAYLVAAEQDAEALKTLLREQLPDYMVPAHLIFLERMPLNPNGKLDRQALPKPDASQAQQDWVAPVTELEQHIAAIWAEILGAERVGLNDHFFEMGGHSLLAMQVVSRLRQVLAQEVPLKLVFEQPRLAGFAAAVQALEGREQAPPLVARNRLQPLLLSYAQERQWFLWQLDPHSAAYHIPSALRLTGQLDCEALQRSFNSLIARHESLRTYVQQEGEGAVQVIGTQVALPIELADIDEADLHARVAAEISRPFNLQQGPLLRVTLLRLAADEHVLVLVQHHIVSDGASMAVMVDELVQLYSAYSRGDVPQLPAMPIQYADYALWQRDWMEAGERQRQLSYWRDLLGCEQPVLELPFDHQRPAQQSHRGARLDVPLPAALAADLKALAQREGVTMFMLLLASFQTLLYRYSGQQDIRVGVPIANRNRVETERLIGFFVNTQVLKADIDGQTTVAQLLQQVKQRALDAQAHQDLPFEQLVQALQPERSLSLNPLFQVMFNYQTDGPREPLALAHLSIENLAWERRTAHFDLDLDTHDSRDGLWASLGYSTDLFDAPTIARMARHWQNLLQAMVADQQQNIGQLNLLDADEQQHILQLWDRSESGFSNARLVHELFADRARENPQAVAVKFDTQTLSYGELDRQANRLAHALIARGVGPEVRVAIAMPRSAESLVAFLGVMKAGGVYVPLDIEYPRDRLLYMMQDSRAQLLLTHSRAVPQLPIAEGLEVLAIDRTEDYAETAPEVALDGDNLAYVIYTSGSTGMPKGVAVSHGPLVAHIIATGERYETGPADCELHFMSFAFDGSHEGWMHPLINGASVLIRDDSLWLPDYTYAQMHRHNVTMAVFPPVYLQQLAEHAERDGNPPAVRVYCFGGDAVAQASYDLAWRALKPTYLFNGYGPTETVVTPLLWKARKGDPCGAVYAPIGTLLGNRSGYVLDAQLNLQPIGVAGELYLGGEGVARGYLERPALTAERFVPDPFGKPGSRVYRSGDLTRGRADGVVDYLGRVDHQVKIRGFRIELGEIEARLREQDSVGETVVVAQDGPTGKQLVAYVVPADAALASETEFRETLRRALKTHLPDYMVPAHFMFLAKMPLTPNGKLDRKGLPQPDAAQSQGIWVEPVTALQQQVAAIWADVLGAERVGLTDHFFELGGHSLLAMQVISRVRQLLAREIALRTLFEQPQLEGFVLALQALQSDEAPLAPAMLAVDRDQPLSLSYAQERQWFLWQLEPESAAYHVPNALRLTGELDRSALQRSFDSLLARHETLRTVFVSAGERTLQRVLPVATLHIDSLALDNPTAELVQALVEAEIARPFDLRQGPLLRVKLLQLSAQEHVLVLVQHHIVSDGWSMQVMVDELVQLYAAYSQGHDVQLPAMPLQYADYALWQRAWMDAGEKQRQLSYWRELLGAEQPVLELPLDHPRPAVQSYRGARLDVALEANVVAGLKALAQREGVTLFMLLLASFQTLLHRYSGQSDIRIGVPIANRNRVETERLIGFFVNTQVLKAEIDGQMSFAQVLQQTKRRALEAQAHQDLPFEQLVEALQPERSLSHNPLFQVMFNHQSELRVQRGEQLPGLRLEGLESNNHPAHFDLSLDTQSSADGLFATLTYATDLFTDATIARMAQHWQHLLHAVAADAHRRVCELPLLAGVEQVQWNNGAAAFQSPLGVHGLFERQAQRRPDAIALCLDEQTLTYAELNRQANQLAHYLIAEGVGPEVLVGVAVERSFAMVVSLLATLKAGGAYVPLDPQYPRERLLHMLEDSGVSLVLTQSHVPMPLPAGLRSVAIDRVALDQCAEGNPQVAVEPQNLAYVIYTSGSTGKPKGVAINHAALTEFSGIAAGYSRLSEDDRVLQFATLNFDGFVEQLYPALTHGATVVLRGAELWDSGRLYAEIIRQGITLADLPTAYWNLFLLDCLAAGPRSYGALRQIHIGGEAMPLDGPAQWLKAGLGHVRLLNTYGPTEATVVSSVLDCSRGEETIGATASPIGRSLPGRALYVLDRDLNLAPLGAVGELYIGSQCGLARAYLNRPLLTAERFVPDPFGGDRLYRTGDLARYRADGVIEYVGRVDHQVKIRGFRIELGEIEALLLAQDGVRETLVLAADNQLVAYLVAAEQDAEALKTLLREQLPDYMVPAHLIFLERMPLNPNGKLDRQALPKPDASQAQQDWVAPVTELEQHIAAIWAEILGAERVGLNDHFFEMGGHSLLAMQVVSRLRNLLGREVPLRSLFEQPRLQGFVASVLADAVNTQPLAPPMVAVGREQPLPLSYAQERQWFLWQLDPHSAAYHIPGTLRLKGRLDTAALQRSFDTLVARHESLRTHVQQDGERAVQVIAAHAEVEISCRDVDEGDVLALVEALIAEPFDLQRGPLMRVNLLRLAEDEHVLVLVQHHIVSDGGSMQVMVDELVQLYAAYSRGQDLQLPELALQYADYASWQRDWMDAGEKHRQLDYWRERLGGEQPVLELPLDHGRPTLQSHRGASLDISVPPRLLAALRQVAQREEVTLFMLLLASFQTLLHRYSGQSDIRVGVPIANRNREETERLIGFFVNTQVLKADIDGQLTVSQLLQQVKQRALEAQAHQDLPFEQLVEALHPERNLSFNPLFQVMFNHQTETSEPVQQLPGLHVSGLEWQTRTAQFDLSLSTQESSDALLASLIYASDLFDAATPARMARHWLNLLEGMAGDGQQRIGQLPLLDALEQQSVVHDWNATAQVYPLQRGVHQLIEEQAARTPDAPALAFAEIRLSYAELNRRANRLAHRLISAGVGPDVLVGVAVERSIEMVVGLLAILKAGGAYVPLDPEYPRERLAYMLEDSGVTLLLTQAHVLEQLPIPAGLHSVVLGESWFEGYGEHNPGIAIDPENLAYVIYTSGSTGQPKGAGNRHSALTNRLCWMQQAYGLDARDTVLQKTPFSFDVSVWEFFWPLMTGARLVVAAPGDHRDPARLVSLINAEQVTTLHFVPSMLQAFLQDPAVSTCHSLQRIVCSGEALPVDAQQQVFAKLPQAGLYNLYGPTEAAIDVTHWTCTDEGSDTVPIGEPIANLRTHVLDAQLLPVPVGVAGELYLGGEGLARSYHRRPALTAERFVPCPFQRGARLYRTGDRVRQRADGVIEYLGRLDHQVKLRGLRIELGEIEARLLEHPLVREATVLVVDSKQLVGYVVLHAADAEWRAHVSAHLARHLPDYMVPAQWVVLEQMPLSPNGKLDRKALPKPDAHGRGGEFAAPQTALQQQIASIWAEVLEVERVGLHDNFFELGGHSLLVLMLKERINRLCGAVLAVNQLMLNPTVAGQARCIEGDAPSSLIVPLNSQTQGTPLYLFHPSFGSVHCYKPIALALREQRPVFGIICRALVAEDGAVPGWTQMVEDYAQQLLSAQPQGAFRLAGWSLGGNLAMEVTYLLEQAGRTVEFVGWIDAPPPARFTAFWEQGAAPSQPQLSAVERRAQMLEVMFPAHAGQVQAQWRQAQQAHCNEEQQWQHLCDWADATLGASFQALKAELQSGGETERSWAIKQILDERLQATDFRAIKAPVSCWWAARSEAGMHQALIESGLREVIGQAGIERSVVIDTTHHRIVDNAEFIKSLVAALA